MGLNHFEKSTKTTKKNSGTGMGIAMAIGFQIAFHIFFTYFVLFKNVVISVWNILQGDIIEDKEASRKLLQMFR